MDTTAAPTFAEVLRRHRIAVGLSQEALAERAGLSARAISDLERGLRRAPYRDTVRALAEALALSAADRATLEQAASRRRGPRLAQGTEISTAVDVPLPLTPLIGRAQEVAGATALLQRADMRLVTLTGTGGVGKTRVALQVAADLAGDFTDGAVFVPLASISDPDHVLAAIAGALGLVELPGRSWLDSLTIMLRGKHSLIVLDNFEHLLPAAPAIANLLERCSRLSVLVTSRAALRLSGEYALTIPPLALPERGVDLPPAGLRRFAAVELFCQRASAVSSTFTFTEATADSVTDIVRRLDGVPLAIELAAARCKLLSPSAILARLERRLALLTDGPRDMPARQQTLRDTIAWSYDLLTPAEQALLRRLSVFAGGWSLEAAEAVCGDEQISVLDGLSSLAEQSLIHHVETPNGEPRFRILETVREFALDKLAAHGEADRLRAGHAAWFHALALRAEVHLLGPQREQWQRTLTPDQNNLRAALEWATTGGDVVLGVDTAAALHMWFMSRALHEGRRWLEQLLDLLPDTAPVRVRARGLFVLGVIVMAQNDLAGGRALLQESIALWRTLDDPIALSRALGQFAISARDVPDQSAAIAAAEESLALALAAGNYLVATHAYNGLGHLARMRRDNVAARAAYQSAVDASRRTGAAYLVGASLNNLAAVDDILGEQDRAAALLTEALSLLGQDDHETQVGWLAVQAQLSHAEITLRQGHTAQAAAIFGEALDRSFQIGSLGEVLQAIDGLGRIAFAHERWARATRLLGAAEHLREEHGILRIYGPGKRRRDEMSEQLRGALGDTGFAIAWATGERWSLSDAVAAALEDEAATSHAGASR